MRVLYVASAVEAGGASGGSTHVNEVACGLAALGHKMLVITRPCGPGVSARKLECDVPLRTIRWRKELALLGLPRIARAVSSFKPDVVMERFYTFAGAGILLAHRQRIPALLEVNAPMIDPPGSLKSKVDRLLLGSMRRWAVRQARWSAAIVTPLASTVPPEVPRRKICELPWGANVERFDPALRLDESKRDVLARELGLAPGVPVAAFLGSFRAWHGAQHFAQAARRILAEGGDMAFLAIGGGPELEPLRASVAGWDLPKGRLVFAGTQPHERVPELLALADIGVAPFDLLAHPPLLSFGFYWSPLKVFEYMAMGLPVVTIDVPPLNDIVRHEREGLLYEPGDIDGLGRALARLGRDRELSAKLGGAARERVVAKYSWRQHSTALDGILREIAHAR